MLEKPESTASSSFDDAWRSIVEYNESIFQDERFQRKLNEAENLYGELCKLGAKSELPDIVNQINTLMGDYIGYDISTSGVVYEVSDGKASSVAELADELRLRLYSFTVVEQPSSKDELRLLAGYEGKEPRSYTVPLTNQILPEAQFSAEYVKAILQSYVPDALGEFDELIVADNATRADILLGLRGVSLIELDILDRRKAESVAAKLSLYMHHVLGLDNASDQIMAYDGRAFFGGTEARLCASSCLVTIDGVGPVYVQTEGLRSEGVWQMAFTGTVNHVDFSGPIQSLTLFVDSIQSAKELNLG